LQSKRSIWSDIEKQITFIPLFSFKKNNAEEALGRFKIKFKQIAKQKSIKSIYFFIDIDALADDSHKILYSAFEYSILNSILYLSLISFNQIQNFQNLSMSNINIKNNLSKK